MRLILASAAAIVAATSAASHSVSQKNKSFSAATLAVKPGEEVTFSNDDSVVHNVFSMTPGLAFNLKAQAPGTSAHMSFDKEGTADVRCAIHPTMKLTIQVKK